MRHTWKESSNYYMNKKLRSKWKAELFSSSESSENPEFLRHFSFRYHSHVGNWWFYFLKSTKTDQT